MSLDEPVKKTQKENWIEIGVFHFWYSQIHELVLLSASIQAILLPDVVFSQTCKYLYQNSSKPVLLVHEEAACSKNLSSKWTYQQVAHHQRL